MNKGMNIKIDDILWKEFSATKLFKIERGNRLIINKRVKGNIPLVTAGFKNEGVAELISNEEQKSYKNSITIDMFGNVFYRGYEFKCDDNIHVLTNSSFTKNISLFVCNCIKQTTENIFSYGKQFRLKTIEKLKILLPVNENGEPHYVFMEQYIGQKENEKLIKYRLYIQKRIEKVKDFKDFVALNEKEWMDFNLEYFFNIFTGGDLIIQNVKLGNFPVISHSKEKNGVAVFSSSIKGKKLFDSNKTISLADRGNFWATTQPIDFYIGTRVKALEFKGLTNKFILKFFSLMINKQESRFSYGNNATGKTNKIKILLPINEKGHPDYDYMENYIKKIEYDKLSKYLYYKKVL
jgi:Type I restriction modification DNA specificity domain